MRDERKNRKATAIVLAVAAAVGILLGGYAFLSDAARFESFETDILEPRRVLNPAGHSLADYYAAICAAFPEYAAGKNLTFLKGEILFSKENCAFGTVVFVCNRIVDDSKEGGAIESAVFYYDAASCVLSQIELFSGAGKAYGYTATPIAKPDDRLHYTAERLLREQGGKAPQDEAGALTFSISERGIRVG